MASLDLKLLGGFAARLGSGQPIQIAGKKNQALLAYLALNEGKKVSREKLIGLLWSDRGEAQGRNSLRQALAALKQALSGVDQSPLILEGEQVALDPARTFCDAVQFTALAKSGSTDDLRRAAKLYVGQLLDGISVRDPAFDDWLSVERVRLREGAATAICKAAGLSSGTVAVSLAQHAIALDPLREASHRALMEAYAAAGERTLALQAYAACRGVLKAELGVVPAKATEELRQRLLEDEPKPPAPQEQAPLTSKRQKAASIAVLPFTNMSADPEQEYFSDGITDDIIIDLSQVSSIYVAARNSTFTFKSTAVDISEVARKLKVGHILEGSIRKSGNRVRITAQLIDAETGDHVWAERYDREIGDIFALQDDISKNVVAALKVRLLPEETRAMTYRSTRNAEAYEQYLLGRSTLYGNWGNKEVVRRARQLFLKAVQIDPGYARAYAGVADCDTYLWSADDLEITTADILANSSKALALAPDLAEAHASKGLALYRSGQPEAAIPILERAIELDPELFEAHFCLGLASRFSGNPEQAAVPFERAAQLRPTDYVALTMLAESYAAADLKERGALAARQAVARIELALSKDPSNPVLMAWGSCALIYLGDFRQAEEWADQAVARGANDYFVRHVVAGVYASLGKPEAAIEGLEFAYARARRARPLLLRWITHDHLLDPLRERPDFQDLKRRLEVAAAENA